MNRSLKRLGMWLGFAAAIIFLGLTVVNASWMAQPPRGKVKLIAHRGMMQQFDRADLGPDDCTATRVEPLLHDFLENTAEGVVRAAELGVRMNEVDLAVTADGELVIFGDAALDCRTDGTGPVSSKTLAELRILDAGYGYSADGGKSFPLRGKGVGAIRSLGHFFQIITNRRPLLYNFSSNDPKEADLLVAKMKEAGRDPSESFDAFVGDPAPVARIKQLYPDAWAFNPAAGRQCASDYVRTGWYGSVPDSCKGGTMLIPVDEQWKFWGWPDRLIDRLEEFDTQIVVTGPQSPSEAMTGLTLPQQLGDVPRSFNGFLWIDDAWTVAPALYPDRDSRNDAQKEAAAAALEKRRARN